MALTRVTNNGLDPNDEFSFNGLNVTGVVTATSGYLINTNTVIDSSRNINTGVLTATTLYGDGSNLTGIDATSISSGNSNVQVVDTGSDGHVKAKTEGTERVRITAAGDVGIGITNPTAKLDVVNDTTNDEEVLRVRGSHGNSGGVVGKTHIGLHYFNASGIDDFSPVRITAEEADAGSYNANLVFSTRNSGADDAPTEKLRIASDGDVGIGTNNPQRRLDVLETASQTVAQIRTAGQTKALTRYQCLGDNPVFVGAARSDFNIEMNGNDVMTINHSNQNVSLTGNVIFPNGKGINFGASQGGGATSDLLDDYEEGTWTPVPQGATTAGSVTAGTISGQYIKIGKLVYATVRMENVTFSGSTGIIRIAGLPFTVANVNAYAAHAWGMTYRISFNSSLNQAWYANPSSTYLYGIESGSGVAWASMVSSNFHNSVMYMNQCVVYEATS